MPNHYAPTATLDAAFQALGDPTRRGIVERLTERPASVSELARPLAMSLPAVMQHLQVLEASGLVRTEKVGRVRTCHLQPQALRQVEQWLHDRRTFWEQRLDRLGELLDAQELATQDAAAQATTDQATTPPNRGPR